MIPLEIRKISTDDPAYPQVYELREGALRLPIGLSLADEDLSRDKEEITLAAFLEDHVVACLMLQHIDEDTLKLRQMAVSEEMRGKNIGRQMLAAAEQTAKELNYKKMILHARKAVLAFYTGSGYTTTSGEFTEVGIPHLAMEKKLA